MAVEQVLRDHAVEAVGAAGGRGFHGLVETGDEGSENLVEFRRLKAVGAGAAQFLFADGERGGPLRGREGDGQVGFAHDLERFAGLGAGAEEPGLLFFGQLGEAAIEHRESDLASEGPAPFGGGVGLGAGQRPRKNRDAGVRHLGFGKK